MDATRCASHTAGQRQNLHMTAPSESNQLLSCHVESGEGRGHQGSSSPATEPIVTSVLVNRFWCLSSPAPSRLDVDRHAAHRIYSAQGARCHRPLPTCIWRIYASPMMPRHGSIAEEPSFKLTRLLLRFARCSRRGADALAAWSGAMATPRTPHLLDIKRAHEDEDAERARSAEPGPQARIIQAVARRSPVAGLSSFQEL